MMVTKGNAMHLKTVTRIDTHMVCPLSPTLIIEILTLRSKIFIIQYVHSPGIVYRDIKLDNALSCLHDPTRVWLVDFGLAKPI